jgi:hypothetical protein
MLMLALAPVDSIIITDKLQEAETDDNKSM